MAFPGLSIATTFIVVLAGQSRAPFAVVEPLNFAGCNPGSPSSNKGSSQRKIERAQLGRAFAIDVVYLVAGAE